MKCTDCGSSGLGKESCGDCGQLNGSAYSPDSVVPEPKAAEVAEQRQVSVLFCDLVDSMALSYRLDPDELEQVIAEFQQICANSVSQFGGHITQLLGDGVLAYFDSPTDIEDDPQRAVNCSLQILQDLKTPAGAMAKYPVRARFGVHTRFVPVSMHRGGDRRETFSLGNVPNVAAQISALADPNTLLVSEATWSLTGGSFKGKSLEPKNLNGLPQPVMIWVILRPICV